MGIDYKKKYLKYKNKYLDAKKMYGGEPSGKLQEIEKINEEIDGKNKELTPETDEVPEETVEVPEETVEVPEETVEVPKETDEAPKRTDEVPEKIEKSVLINNINGLFETYEKLSDKLLHMENSRRRFLAENSPGVVPREFYKTNRKINEVHRERVKKFIENGEYEYKKNEEFYKDVATVGNSEENAKIGHKILNLWYKKFNESLLPVFATYFEETEAHKPDPQIPANSEETETSPWKIPANFNMIEWLRKKRFSKDERSKWKTMKLLTKIEKLSDTFKEINKYLEEHTHMKIYIYKMPKKDLTQNAEAGATGRPKSRRAGAWVDYYADAKTAEDARIAAEAKQIADAKAADAKAADATAA